MGLKPVARSLAAWALAVPALARAQTAPPAAVAPAQNELQVEELERLSLEELLNLEVTTASKVATRVSDTAVVIEVITAEQIWQRGYRHLADVLNDIPSNHQDWSNWGIGEPVSQNVGLGFRFDTGQNILLLFNGQRLNAFIPGNRFGGEEYLLGDLERIEIIRGPGSALYGANAFTAVVNLISKQEFEAGEQSQVRLTQGGLPTSGGLYQETSWKLKLFDEGVLSGALRLARDRGQSRTIENTAFGDRVLRDELDHALDGELLFRYRWFRAYFKADNQKRSTFTGFNSINPPGNDKLKLRMGAYAFGTDATFKLSSNVELKATVGLHLDKWVESYLFPWPEMVSVVRDRDTVLTSLLIDGQGARTRSADGELQLTWRFLERGSVVAGVNIIHDRVLEELRPSEIDLTTPPGEPAPYTVYTGPPNGWMFDPSASRLNLGSYGQLEYSFGKHLVASAGARVDHYNGTGVLRQQYLEVTPRGGVVFKHPSVGVVKAMYGKATRIPNGFETLSAYGILGSPSNRPERIHVIQAAWNRQWASWIGSELGGFYATISNRLQTDANIDPSLMEAGFIGRYTNVRTPDHPSSAAIEGKLSLRWRDAELATNITQFVHTDDGTGAELGYIPLTLVNGNLNIPVKWLTINLGARCRGQFTQPASDPRPPVQRYALLNATLSARHPVWPLELRTGLRNLLNSRIQAPSSSVAFTDHFVQRGIEVWLDLTAWI